VAGTHKREEIEEGFSQTSTMIKGVLIVNNHGAPRLVKFYHPIPSTSSPATVIRRIFNQVASRPDSFCNYLEGTVPEWSGKGTKLIYRHYATLYFVFAVDQQESDLGILDLIQVFVEGEFRITPLSGTALAPRSVCPSVRAADPRQVQTLPISDPFLLTILSRVSHFSSFPSPGQMLRECV
jgi:hypothetical protein